MSVPAGFALFPLIKLGKTADECWEWQAAFNSAGYPRKTHNGADLQANRWMWLTLFGPIPEGLVVSTTCGNRACVHPAHLVLRTQAEACREGVAATLTARDIGELRRLVDNGVSPAELAERYGVSPQTISDVKRRKSWKPRNKHRAGGRPARAPMADSAA